MMLHTAYNLSVDQTKFKMREFATGFAMCVFGYAMAVTVWGVLFDNTGGEPFSNAVYGACGIFPFFVPVAVIGGYYYAVKRPVRNTIMLLTVLLFGCAVLLFLYTSARNVMQ